MVKTEFHEFLNNVTPRELRVTPWYGFPPEKWSSSIKF